MSNTQRNTSQRDRDRARIKATRADCHICGQPVDYSLPHTDPMSFVVDHVVPLAKGGIDALSNKMAAHRRYIFANATRRRGPA
jgi:5-methylcytosine-specific restriction endonuclease McrA